MHADCGSQILPQAVGHAEVDLNDLGVELRSGTASNLFAGGLEAVCLTIRPVRGDGVERVRHGKYSCAQRDLLRSETSRVSGSIKVFLVAEDDLCRLLQEGNLAQHLVSAGAMFAHHRLLGTSPGGRA